MNGSLDVFKPLSRIRLDDFIDQKNEGIQLPESQWILEGSKKIKAPPGCNDRCYFATGRRCKCKCRGSFHGLGWQRISGSYSYEPIRDPRIVSLFHNAECLVCRRPLRGASILGYPHPDGLPLPDGRRLWVFAICPSCNYRISLTKIAWKLAEGSSSLLELEEGGLR